MGQRSTPPGALQPGRERGAGCDYCLSAHTYLGKNVARLDDSELASSREGRSADAKVEAALRFATAIVRARGHVTAAEFADARAAGYNDAQC